MARPRKVIDERQVEALASIMCTTEEIAAVVGCSQDTLERRFAAALENGRLRGRQSIRRKVYHLAMEGNAAMLVWLSKQYLGQTDALRHELSGDVNLTHALPPETQEKYDRLREMIRNATNGRSNRFIEALKRVGAGLDDPGTGSGSTEPLSGASLGIPWPKGVDV